MNPSEGTTPLPLFPLSSVLLPGAATTLRIFEPRYLDLVRDCGRSGSGFGVCLILEGSETGAPALPAAVGTLAAIEDFDRDADGLLVLRVRGGRRFRVRQVRVRDNGLVVADVVWLADDVPARTRPEHMLLAELLRRMLERAVGEGVVRIPEHHFADAAWVGWRLAELLPLGEHERQALLQEDDVHARLQQLLEQVV